MTRLLRRAPYAAVRRSASSVVGFLGLFAALGPACETDLGERVVLNKKAVEADLVIYVNLNLVPMDGGHKSTATGLATTAAITLTGLPVTAGSYTAPPVPAAAST